MSTKIGISGLSDAVQEILNSYRDDAIDALNEAVDDAGKTVKEEIETRASSLFKGKKYAKSWAVKETAKTALGKQVTVHSPSQYRIAHLLENGHAKRGGGRVDGRAHIAPAEEIGEKKLIENLEKKLGGGQ